MSVFLWKIEVQVAECQGIAQNPKAEYSLLLRLGDQFSPSSAPGQFHTASSKVSFNTTLRLAITSSTPQLPHSQLQIILVMLEKNSSGSFQTDNLEEIIGISTITVFYPVQEYLEGFRMFRFDKSLDSKGTVKARIKITKQEQQPQTKPIKQRSPTKARMKTFSMSNSSSDVQSQAQKLQLSKIVNNSSTVEVQKAERYRETIDSLTQERNQLYKMSEQLYAELKKCIDERDEYLRQLRERVLSEQMMKAEMDFLKLKVNQYEENHHNKEESLNHSRSYHQLDDLRRYSEDMLQIVEEKDKKIKELERQVKESIVALNQFKREALNARQELIHKQSQLSMISQQTKTLEPAECIQEILKELEDRKFDHPFDFSKYYSQEGGKEAKVQMLKKQISVLFTKLFSKIKVLADKQWLLKQKIRFEKMLQENLLYFLNDTE